MKTSTEIIVALNVQIESCYLPSMKYLCIRKRSCHFSSFLRQAFALSPLCLHFLPINIPSPWVLLLEHWSRGLQHQSSTWWKKLMQLYQHHFFKCYPRSNISADTFKNVWIQIQLQFCCLDDQIKYYLHYFPKMKLVYKIIISTE